MAPYQNHTLLAAEGGGTLPQTVRSVDGITVNNVSRSQGEAAGHPLVTTIERGQVDLLDRMADEWRQLCQEGPCDQPFFYPEWIATSIRSFSGKQQVVLVTVRDAGRLRAVLPLLEERVWACGIPARKLRSAASHSPRFELIHGGGPGMEQALKIGWSDLQKRGGWDVIELMNVPEGGAAERFAGIAKQDGFSTYQYLWAKSPYIDLSGYDPAEEFSQFARSRRFRYRLRQLWRKLQKEGDVSLQRVSVADPEALERFYRMEQSGWKGKRGTAIACDPQTRHFYNAIANFSAERGCLSLYFLRQGNRDLAAHFGLTWGGRYYPLKVAFDESYSQYGPGHLVIGSVLQDCASHGLSEFDCMGQWTEPKGKWASGVRPHQTCYIFQNSVAGRILQAQIPAAHRFEAAIGRLKHSLGLVRRGHTPPADMGSEESAGV